MPRSSSTTLQHKPVRIIIADSEPITMEGLCKTLARQKQFSVVDRVNNGEQLVQRVNKLRPNVVIMDLNLPVKDSITATKEIKKNFPDIQVLVFTRLDDDVHITEMMVEAKAIGYVLKNASKAELLEAIENVSCGQHYCSPAISSRLVALMQRTGTNPIKPFSKPSFTELELEVLKQTGLCLGPKQIAQKLGIDVRSVESAIQRLLQKSRCTNSKELALYAVRNFLAPL